MLYIKYLLEDFTELSIEEQCDIVLVIQDALSKGIFTKMHLNILRMFVRRYSVSFIALKLGLTDLDVRDTLLSMFHYLENKTGYTDSRILRNHPKYKDSVLDRCAIIAAEELA
jgi:hypothetical protein